ncbi:phosphatidate cytidylyltransferase [bacterium]|nr:phosphatidate cytidylyltransferase [bacterium]
MSPNLRKRILIAFTFGPLFLALIWLGKSTALIFTYFISLGMTIEFLNFPGFNLSKLEKSIPIIYSLWTGVLFYFNWDDCFLPTLLFFLFVLIVIELLRTSPEGSSTRMGRLLLALLIFGLLPHFGVKLRDMGRVYLFYPLVLVWVLDTFAYFGGKWWGKVKMVPHISPNKTIAGALTGLIGAILTGAAFGFFSTLKMGSSLLLALMAGIIGQFSDLIASRLKREVQLKDSSSLIPGHGGIIDAFDTVILIFPLFYLWFSLLDF